MAVDERARRRLYVRLEEILGPEGATILMEHLPSVRWGDVATKHDLDQSAGATKRDLDLRLEATKHELIATFRQEFVRQTRTMIFAVIGAVASVGGLVVVAARLG